MGSFVNANMLFMCVWMNMRGENNDLVTVKMRSMCEYACADFSFSSENFQNDSKRNKFWMFDAVYYYFNASDIISGVCIWVCGFRQCEVKGERGILHVRAPIGYPYAIYHEYLWRFFPSNFHAPFSAIEIYLHSGCHFENVLNFISIFVRFDIFR